MPYRPAKFICSDEDPIPAQRSARRAHDGQICTIVEPLEDWTYYRIRFADGVKVIALESEVSNATYGLTP